jgi:hypothetical protein
MCYAVFFRKPYCTAIRNSSSAVSGLGWDC